MKEFAKTLEVEIQLRIALPTLSGMCLVCHCFPARPVSLTRLDRLNPACFLLYMTGMIPHPGLPRRLS